MQINKVIILKFLIFMTGIITILSILSIDDNYPETYILIPTIYLIFIIIMPNVVNYSLHGIGILALNLVMYLRYLITPLFNTIFGREIQIVYLSTSSYDTAIWLMIYEMFMVFLFFSLMAAKTYSKKKIPSNLTTEKNYIGWLFILFCVGLIVVFPHLISNYSFIFTSEQFESKYTEESFGSSLSWFISLGRLVLIMSIINLFYKKYEKNPHVKYFIYTFLSILLICSFISGTSRFSIILPLISGLFVCYIIYKNYRTLTLIFSTIVILSTIIITTTIKNNTIYGEGVSNTGFFESFTQSLNLYFSGIINVATSVESRNIYLSFDFESIFSDIFNSVVLINAYFNSAYSALESFNIIFYNGGPARDQILPIIGQGYLYFGFVLSPILLIISLGLLIYFDKKAMKTNEVFLKFIFSYIAIKLGLIMMSNFTIILSFITNNFIPIMILLVANKLFTKR